VNDRLYWRFPGVDTETALLELFSAEGKSVLRIDQLPTVGSLELEKLPAGLYTCRMSFGSHSVVKKLVVE
jgi:hypothetical protein